MIMDRLCWKKTIMQLKWKCSPLFPKVLSNWHDLKPLVAVYNVIIFKWLHGDICFIENTRLFCYFHLFYLLILIRLYLMWVILFCFRHVCLAVYHMCLMLMKVRRGHWIPWNWNYRWLWIPMWDLAIKS